MNGEQIRQRVVRHVVADVLTLGHDNGLGSSAIDGMLATYFGGTLVARVGEWQVGENSLTCEALLQTPGFLLCQQVPELRATLRFGATGEMIQLAVVAAMPEPYTLGDSFVPIGRLPSVPLRALRFTEAAYTIDSTRPLDSLQFQARTGSDRGPLRPFAWAFAQGPVIQGEIHLSRRPDGIYPELNLQSALVSSPSVGGLAFQFALRVRSRLVEPRGSGEAPRLLTAVDLITDLVTPRLTVPMAIALLDENATLVQAGLDLTRPLPALNSLEELAGLTGGADLAGALSADTPIGTLSLDSLSLMLDTAHLQVSHITVGVRLGTDWPIITDAIRLRGLKAVFTIPFGLDPKELAARLTAMLSVGGVAIDAYLLYPQKVVGAHLADGATIPIGELLTTFAPRVALPGSNDLAVYVLDFVAAVGEGRYSLSCQAAGSLALIPGLELHQLEFIITFANGHVAELSFSSLFAIAGTELFLGATMDSTGWLLSGGMHQRSEISLTDLAADLLRIFKIELPAKLPQVRLTALELSHFHTATGAFGFRAAISVGAKATVNELLGGFGLPAEGVPQTLALAAISIERGAEEGAYAVDLTVDQIWQAGPVALERVGLKISHQKATGFGGHFTCSMAVGQRVRLDLTAGYDAVKGWHFVGGMGPGDELSIDDLLDHLAETFDIDEDKVPKPIRSLTLTALRVGYETKTGRFAFACGCRLFVAETAVEALVTIAVESGEQGYSATFGGQLLVNGLQFDLVFNTRSTGQNLFAATYSHTDEQKPILLRDLVAGVSESAAALVPAGIAIDLRDIKLLFVMDDQGKRFALGLDLAVGIDLADLPLVGDKLPPELTVAVRSLQFAYASQALKQADADLINPLLPKAVSPLPADGLPQGLSLEAEVQVGSEVTAISLGLSKPEEKAASLSVEPAEATPSSAKWFNIQKQIGIFQFNRIGIDYQHNTLFFLLDAAMTAGPLTLSLDGLAVGSPLDRFAPTFNLDGLGLAYAQGSVAIVGALLKVPQSHLEPDVAFQFDGMLAVRAGQYGLGAIGSYAQFTSGEPSLFVFAQLLAPLGGHPAFFITGLMGGFGFNRALELPIFDQVLGFPLIALGAPPNPGGKGAQQDPKHVLAVMEGRAPVTPGGVTKAWIRPKPGTYWLAAGLQVSHFQMVQTRALLIAVFSSEEIAFALLGVATMQLPLPGAGGVRFAYVELALAAVIKPMEGFVGVTAALSQNSYLLVPECRLTGGFAFYLWFGRNPHAGEFVLTLGGYHPAFKVPDHFPQVPRLGFNWAVSDTVSIKGGVYFALTTSCAMAGGALEIVFHSGGLRAWFTAHADFLLSWKPLYYTAEVAVEVGISYRLSLLGCHKTISASLGATLDLWGPPTGGRATIHLWFISFTVAFGARQTDQQQAPLQWSEFKELLPKPEEVCTIAVASGLYKTVESRGSSSGQAWVVRAGDFSFETQSAIPASHLRYGAEQATSLLGQSDLGISIRPMNQTGVTSLHQISIFRGSDPTPIDATGWSLTPRYQNMPESLWGAPPAPFKQIPDRPTADLVPNQPVGYAVQAPEPVLGPSPGLIPMKELAREFLTPGRMPVRTGEAPSTDYVPSVDQRTVGQIAQIMQGDVRQQRDALYRTLQGAGLYGGQNGDLTEMAARAESLYSAPPMRQS